MTSAEIVKALRCCEHGGCIRCPLYSDKQHCQERALHDAAEMIERLEKERAALLENVRGGCISCKHWARDTINCKVVGGCTPCRKDCKCKDCGLGENWEWKGADEE